jgi:hypothetical protein
MSPRAALCAVVVALVAGSCGTASAATGLAAHWRLDEGSGTTAADASGNGNHGSLPFGGSWVPGHFGSALGFDDTTGSLLVPSSASLEPAAVTAMAWVKAPGSPGKYRYVLAKGATGCIASAFAMYTGPSGGLRFYVSSDGAQNYTLSPDAGAEVWDGTWHHAAGTFDGTSVRLFLDGIEVASGTPRTAPIDYGSLDTRDLYVGHYQGCNFPPNFRGSIDEPKIFGRALTASEIETAMLRYEFTGFFAPVENSPVVNDAKAGSAVPVKFSLGGSFGLDIFALGSPSSYPVPCSTSSPLDAIEETSSAGASGLTYDAITDRYQYVWKTSKGWAGSCRNLLVQLNDSTAHVAKFKFK